MDSVDVTAGGIRVPPLAASALCPICGSSSQHANSRYDRTLADASIGNRPSFPVLRARRFSRMPSTYLC